MEVGVVQPCLHVVAASRVVGERVAYDSGCGGGGDFARCDIVEWPSNLASDIVQMESCAKLIITSPTKGGLGALHAELEDTHVLGHGGVEATARFTASGELKVGETPRNRLKASTVGGSRGFASSGWWRPWLTR
jgi:hypothetical protein